jgi:hypothetical protein
VSTSWVTCEGSAAVEIRHESPSVAEYDALVLTVRSFESVFSSPYALGEMQPKDQT